jgi:Zn finger protein HypA/HybF involved in hydrogenase expression
VLTRAQGRAQRAAIMRDIARDLRRKQREELRALRLAIGEARVVRKAALREAREACKRGRVDVRQRVKEMRARLLAEMRAALIGERTQARQACTTAIAAARGMSSRIEQAREKLRAERQYRREMRRIEAANRARKRELAPRRGVRERMSESDDEVRSSIPPELVALFERVKRQIRGSERWSRTEAFLHYAQEHPSEVLESIEDKTEETIRELEARERRAARALSRPIPRAALAEAVPF